LQVGRNGVHKTMITLTREEAQQVLDALSDCREDSEELFYEYKQKYGDHYKPQRITFQQSVLDQSAQAIETLRARLSAPEPEPVAWMNESDIGKTDWKVWAHGKPTATMPLYAAPPKFEPSVEPVAWHEPGAYGNVTVYQKWAEENGWLPLYTAPSQKNA